VSKDINVKDFTVLPSNPNNNGHQSKI
jgi:hypothetical protein